MGAGAGGQVPAPGQQLHGPVVDLLVAGDGIGHGFPAFREGWGVQNDEVILYRFLFQLGQQVKDIGRHAVHNVGYAVALCIGPGHLHGGFRHIHCRHMGRAAQRGIQGEGAGVGEAVQNGFSRRQTAHRPPVVLLIQEKAGFLTVFHVHQILDPVFHDLHHRAVRGCFAGEGIPALALRKTFLCPESHVVPQEYAPDGLAVPPENIHQSREQEVL